MKKDGKATKTLITDKTERISFRPNSVINLLPPPSGAHTASGTTFVPRERNEISFFFFLKKIKKREKKQLVDFVKSYREKFRSNRPGETQGPPPASGSRNRGDRTH